MLLYVKLRYLHRFSNTESHPPYLYYQSHILAQPGLPFTQLVSIVYFRVQEGSIGTLL